MSTAGPNETIVLSLQPLVEEADWSGLPGWNGYSVPAGTDVSGAPTKMAPVVMRIDEDFDSSFKPCTWVTMSVSTDDEPHYRLTYGEASRLRNRLNQLLDFYDNLTSGEKEKVDRD